MKFYDSFRKILPNNFRSRKIKEGIDCENYFPSQYFIFIEGRKRILAFHGSHRHCYFIVQREFLWISDYPNCWEISHSENQIERKFKIYLKIIFSK